MSFGHFLNISKDDFFIYLLVIIVTILVTFFIYNKLNKESFANFSEQNTFTKSQRDLFWNKMNKGVDFDPSMAKDLEWTNSALKTVIPLSSQKIMPKIPSFFLKSPLPGNEAKEQECLLIKAPKFLPSRNPQTNAGCGWWFIENPAKDSVSVQGNVSGPFDNNTSNKYPGGRWVWDLAEAQKLEDMKKCKAIKICEQADIFPGECGFCLSTNIGVPVNKFGKNKYPNDPNINCDDIVTKSNLCPRNPIVTLENIDKPTRSISEPVNGKLTKEFLISLALAAGCTNDGILIKILASGNPKKYLNGTDKDAELFKIANRNLQSEENIPLKMEFYGIGPCEKSEAVKYYLQLRKAATSGKSTSSRSSAEFITRGTPFDPCLYADNEKGPFSLFCLKRVALENNCQPDGLDFPKKVKQKPISAPPYCKKLGRPAEKSDLRLYTKAECDSLNGKFQTNGECLKKGGGSYSRECRELNRVNSNSSSTKDKYDRMSWTQVNQYFQNLYTSMNSSLKDVQADATKRCLGINVVQTPTGTDSVVGCEVLWYTWNFDFKMPEKQFYEGTFLGRVIQPLLPSFNSEQKDGSFNPFNISTNITFHIRTIYKPKISSEKKIGVVATDGICIKIDNRPVIKKWLAGPQQILESNAFVINTGDSKQLNIYWFKENERSTFLPKISHNSGRGDYSVFEPGDLELTVPENYPLCRWDFYNDSKNDSNSVLSSQNNNIIMGQKDRKRCGILNKNSSIIINNNVRGGIFKSFTYNVYPESIPGYWSRLFSFRRGPTNCDGGFTHTNSITVEGGLCEDGSLWMGLKTNNGGFFVWNKTAPNVFKMNKWCHVAFVYDDDMKGSTIYVDGELINRTRDENCPESEFINTIYNNVAIGLGHYSKECNEQPIICGLGWAHWFDYTIDRATIRDDIATAFSNKKYFPAKEKSGWGFK